MEIQHSAVDASLCNKGERHGTKITFHPDPEIFKNVLEFSFEQLATKLRELAYLNSGLEIVIVDERTDKRQVFGTVDLPTSPRPIRHTRPAIGCQARCLTPRKLRI